MRRGTDAVRRATPPPTPDAPTDLSTRDRVTRLLLEQGAATAGQLGSALGLSPAAIRRHLDAMLADGDVVAREQTVRGSRGRGRPAKVFLLTDAARRRCGTHHYDNMATAALRWIARNGGPDAVEAFAADQVAALEARCRAAMEDAGDDPLARSEALAGALTAEGYAANASTIASGGQLCQHHCPVAHVAAEFPSCARPRRRSSPVWSAPTCSVWPPSRTATGCAPRTFRPSRAPSPVTPSPL